ncbi:MAG: hypothetical protein M3Y82_05905 [Verrucomicrobiota bacterium]|nr:hypothetical protein [Verrucomicrobiota bacterium]
MKTEKNYVPKAQREVWEWKDSISQEVKHLPTGQALRKILETASRATEQLGFAPEQASIAIRT